MGALNFCVKIKGDTAEEAFFAAVDEAAYESGHGGYTGTIAEKSGFTIIPHDPEKSIREQVDDLIDDNDKWGPAFCFDLGDGSYVFFGTASF